MTDKHTEKHCFKRQITRSHPPSLVCVAVDLLRVPLGHDKLEPRTLRGGESTNNNNNYISYITPHPNNSSGALLTRILPNSVKIIIIIEINKMLIQYYRYFDKICK